MALIAAVVLIDRGDPEYPIRADFVGRRIELPADRRIAVRFEPDDAPGVYDEPWIERHPDTKE